MVFNDELHAVHFSSYFEYDFHRETRGMRFVEPDMLFELCLIFSKIRKAIFFDRRYGTYI